MTSEELETIVCKHEMQRLELKESFGVECIETACAFTNAQGGFIVIGVDNDGNPSKHQLRGEGLRDYENKISTATEPSVAVDAEKGEFRDREVVILRGIENPLKPVAYKGRCYIRKGEFATTYRPRVASGDSAEITPERAGEIGESAEKKGESAGENKERTGEDVERAGKINEWLAAAIPSGIRQDARKNIVSILKEIAMDERITVERLCLQTGLSERGVWKIISSLKALGLLDRIGPDKGGHWKLVGFEP